MYEWRYGEPPLRIEESVLFVEPEASVTTDDAVGCSLNIFCIEL